MRVKDLLKTILFVLFVVFGANGATAKTQSYVSGYPQPDFSPRAVLKEVEPNRPIVSMRRHSYERSLELYMEFLKDDLGWPLLMDDRGEKLPHYFFSWGSNRDNRPIAYVYDWPLAESYPAAHHAQFIITFLRYYIFTGQEDWRQRAIQLGDWNIAHSTPGDCKYPYLPYTLYRYPDFVQQLMIDKAPQMGLAYLELYNFTDQQKYKEAAVRIASTLAKCQRPEGNWVQKVDINTGEILVPYTSNVIKMVEFFNRLADVTGTAEYREPAERAWRWLIANPVKDLKWYGGYEDWSDTQLKEGLQWLDTVWTVCELVRRRSENPEYIEMARQQIPWIIKTFGHWEPAIASVQFDKVKPEMQWGNRALLFKGVAPNFDESTVFVPTNECTVRWGLANAAMYIGTERRENIYLEYAVSALNCMTYEHLDDGRATYILNDVTGWTTYYGLCSAPVFYTLDIFRMLPELCAPGENHILDYTCGLSDVRYQAGRVAYSTKHAGREMVKLASEPKAVKLNNRSLKKHEDAEFKGDGWYFDKSVSVLYVRHKAGGVETIDTDTR